MTAPSVTGPQVPVGLVTYSVKPRGGAVHTVHLAEALYAAGYPVRVIALGDPEVGFFRPVRAPVTIIPAPPPLPTLEERVFASVAALAEGLGPLAAGYPVLHTQDCISARAACQVRDGAGGPAPVVLRTVHHVDDFTSPSLIECQRQAILEPDRILVVSEHWRDLLRREYGTKAQVVHNGVDSARFRAADPGQAKELRRRAGAAGRPLILSVGGIEPRKGSDTLVHAIAALKKAGRDPVLAVVGGHSFQDYRPYRDRVLASLPGLGLRLDDDVILVGTVPDAELPAWYAAADVLAFPSTKEGWGLAILEAMSAGLPVVASDLPVFREYLTSGRDALLVPVDDAAALAGALAAVLDDPNLAASLRKAARATGQRFTWARSAAEHQAIYASLTPAGLCDLPVDEREQPAGLATPAHHDPPGAGVVAQEPHRGAPDIRGRERRRQRRPLSRRQDRDNRAAAKSHRLPDQLRREHDPAQVQVQRVTSPGRIRHGETRLRETPGVADQYPRPPRPSDRRVDRGPYPGLGRDVRLDERPADPRRGPRTSLPVQIGDDHVHALGRQPLRDPRPDPGRAAGYQSGQSVNIHASILRRPTDIPADRASRSLAKNLPAMPDVSPLAAGYPGCSSSTGPACTWPMSGKEST